MENVLKDFFGGGSKSAETPVPLREAEDFADFAGAADPAPAPPLKPASNPFAGASTPQMTARPYTKWYNIHERYTLADFRSEGLILACIAVVLVLHLVGARANRAKARRWMRAHAAPLAAEFAQVGFLPPAAGELPDNADAALRESSLFEFATYATGRQNVASLDARLTLVKRFNPVMVVVEYLMGFAMESAGQPQDSLEAVLVPFNGREAALVPGPPGSAEVRQAKEGGKNGGSAFDGFVWALVNKDSMKQVRDDRYDVSITATRDNSKLPTWLTVMTESAEITDALLTPELIKAAESAGELFDYLIITDQPVEKPKTIDDTKAHKRIYFKYRLPANDDYAPLLPLFQHFVRLPDQLAQGAHFRPEVMRKVRATREEVVRRIQKASEEERAEERALEREKSKKARRDQELSGLDAKAQKKFLEREREKEMRKMSKKQTTRA